METGIADLARFHAGHTLSALKVETASIVHGLVDYDNNGLSISYHLGNRDHARADLAALSHAGFRFVSMRGRKWPRITIVLANVGTPMNARYEK